jgi:hypothetical protein
VERVGGTSWWNDFVNMERVGGTSWWNEFVMERDGPTPSQP